MHILEAIAQWNPWWLAIALNTALLLVAIALPKKLLTPAGYLHAWVLGVLIWGTLGWRGYAVVMFYFLVGSAVTKIGMEQKEAAGIAEKRSGARGPENVWGSALVATLCAIAVFARSQWGGSATLNGPTLNPAEDVWFGALTLGYAASFATKLSDTAASEVGKAYGRHTFLITTFKAVPRGTEGAVSLEGTLAGVVASAAIALLARTVGLIDDLGILWCLVAAFVATTAESAIGATWQDKIPWLSNELVNVINTFLGAAIAIALGAIVL